MTQSDSVVVACAANSLYRAARADHMDVIVVCREVMVTERRADTFYPTRPSHRGDCIAWSGDRILIPA